MSEEAKITCAYEVFVDDEQYLAIPRLFQNSVCVQISLCRPWNENDITSALVAEDGKLIEATRLVVRNDYEDNQQINCDKLAVADETRLLVQRLRRIAGAVLACDPVFVAVPRNDIGILDIPNLPATPLALHRLALRSTIRIAGIRAPHL